MSRIFSDSSSKSNNNRLTRLSSTDLSASVDPLRLIKVNSNPLGKQAEKTLELLEQQNEWKKERWKELSEGINDQPPSNEDWQSSLTRWKTRRRSEPLYSQRPLQLAPLCDETDNNAKQLNTVTSQTTTLQTSRLPTEVDEPRFNIEHAQSLIEDSKRDRDVTTPQQQSIDDISSYGQQEGLVAPTSYDVINDVASSAVASRSDNYTNLTDNCKYVVVTSRHHPDVCYKNDFKRTEPNGELETFSEEKSPTLNCTNLQPAPLLSNQTVANVKSDWNEDHSDWKVGTVTSTNTDSDQILAPSVPVTTDKDSDGDIPPPLPSARPPSLHWTMYSSHDRYCDGEEFEYSENVEITSMTSSIMSANPTDSNEKMPRKIAASNVVQKSSIDTSDQVMSSLQIVSVPTAESVSKNDIPGTSPSRTGNVIARVGITFSNATSFDCTGQDLERATSEHRTVPKDCFINGPDNGSATILGHVTETSNSTNQNALSRQESAVAADQSSIYSDDRTSTEPQTSARVISGATVAGHVVASSARRHSGALLRMNASPKPKYIDSGAWIGRQQKTSKNNNLLPS